MKARKEEFVVSFPVSPDDTFRRALRAYYGKEGLATDAEVVAWYRRNAFAVDADMLHEYHEDLKATFAARSRAVQEAIRASKRALSTKKEATP